MNFNTIGMFTNKIQILRLLHVFCFSQKEIIKQQPDMNKKAYLHLILGGLFAHQSNYFSKQLICANNIIVKDSDLFAQKNKPCEMLFFGERDLHGIRLCDLEALQCFSCSTGLHLILKLHKGDVVTTRDQTHLFEAREPKDTTDSVLALNNYSTSK